MTPETALQAAITAALAADATVTGLIGAKVFDGEQQDSSTLPYAYFGPMLRKRREEGFGSAWTITARMYVDTDEVGRDLAWDIADAIAGAVDGIELTLSGPFASADVIRAITMGDVIEPNLKSVYVDLQTTIEKIEE